MLDYKFIKDKLDCNKIKYIFPPKYTTNRVKINPQKTEDPCNTYNQ